jgi:Ca-activated chloride channel family protein
VRVKGRIGGVMRRRDIAVDLDDRTDHPGLASVWARAKIADLSAQAIQTAKPELHEQIKLVALEYSLMSAYTAFVAVDTESRTAGDHGVTVAVPVPVPEGVRYDTTVHE